MGIVLCTYFGVNVLITTYYLESNLKWSGVKDTIIFSFICLLLGSFVSVLLFLFKLFSPILGWIYREINFQFIFYFTNYWDKIFLDDSYSEIYKNRQEKLKRVEELVKNISKQIVRHSKQIQNKYGDKGSRI